MKPAGPMAEACRYLAGLGLPDRDLGELPTSAKRFRDGAQYRVEIPSVEGPEPFRAVIDAAKERELRVHRISQGSGMMLLTDDEIEAMVALGVEHGVEVCLFVGPRAAWDVGVQATARLLEDLGATTLNLPIDLTLAQIAAIRQAVAVPLDVYVEGADDFGGAVRYYEVPELVRVAAPVHLKFTVRNAPGLYPSGEHLAGLAVASARERVRRAAIGVALLRRHYPDAVAST